MNHLEIVPHSTRMFIPYLLQGGGIGSDGRCLKCGRRNAFVGPFSANSPDGTSHVFYQCSGCRSMVHPGPSVDLVGVTDF